MDVPELLRRATALVPANARSDAGLCADEVREYLDHDEWEVALGILEDFDGIQWQPVEFWGLLAEAAEQMWLKRDAAWCHWRAAETRHGIIRAELRLVSPERGGRRLAVPGAGQLRPMWALGSSAAPGEFADLHVAAIWVESAPEIQPGRHGTIRLLPLSPANWRHLAPGDVITMHEGRPAGGTAMIIETEAPPPPATGAMPA